MSQHLYASSSSEATGEGGGKEVKQGDQSMHNPANRLYIQLTTLQSPVSKSLDQESETSLGTNPRDSVDCAFNVFSTSKFLVQPPQYNAHNDRHDNGQCCSCAIHTQGNRQIRRTTLWLRIHVACINRARITDRVDESQCSRPLRWRTRQRVGDPGQSYDISSVYTRYHQHHGDVARCCCSRSGGKDEGCYADAEREDDMEESFAGAVGMPGVEVGGDDCENIRWRC